MAEQSTERATVEVGKKLIGLIVPDLDPELVQLILRRMAHITEYGRTGRKGQREGLDEDQVRVLQEQVGLLVLIWDADIDQAHLRAFLGASGS
jgi:hypothetical protein